VKEVPCPRCGQPALFAPENKWRPFCSERCKLLDLSHWVDGDYRIAGESMTDETTIEDADPETGTAPGQAGSSTKRPR